MIIYSTRRFTWCVRCDRSCDVWSIEPERKSCSAPYDIEESLCGYITHVALFVSLSVDFGSVKSKY
jgi:hypothetical protein